MKYSAWVYTLYGELTLRLRGDQVPSCFSHLQAAKIPLKSVKVTRSGDGLCTICLKDFDQVYAVCRANGVRFRIVARHGAPFWRKRLWKRKAFALGALLFVCIVYGLSSMVWRIDITGPESDEGVAEVREAAKAVGIFVGQRTAAISDPVKLQQQLLAKAPHFVWMGVQTTGSVTTIQAIPKIEGTKPSSEQPQNIIASRPAVIRDVAATRGRVVVQKDQYVHPGQVLISGTLSDGEPNVSATGKVMGEVWYTSKVTVPLKVVQDGLTGASVKRDYLRIGQMKLRVWGWEEPHYAATYERDKESQWKIAGLKLPIQWETDQLYETTKSAKAYSLEQGKLRALELASADVQTHIGSEDSSVLGQSVLHEQVSHGTLYETVLTRVNQDIGVPSAIPANPVQPKEEGSTNQAKKPGTH